MNKDLRPSLHLGALHALDSAELEEVSGGKALGILSEGPPPTFPPPLDRHDEDPPSLLDVERGPCSPGPCGVLGSLPFRA